MSALGQKQTFAAFPPKAGKVHDRMPVLLRRQGGWSEQRHGILNQPHRSKSKYAYPDRSDAGC
jgi:hypothetical protein